MRPWPSFPPETPLITMAPVPSKTRQKTPSSSAARRRARSGRPVIRRCRCDQLGGELARQADRLDLADDGSGVVGHPLDRCLDATVNELEDRERRPGVAVVRLADRAAVDELDARGKSACVS
jgi:hypothetical protein